MQSKCSFTRSRPSGQKSLANCKWRKMLANVRTHSRLRNNLSPSGSGPSLAAPCIAHLCTQKIMDTCMYPCIPLFSMYSSSFPLIFSMSGIGSLAHLPLPASHPRSDWSCWFNRGYTTTLSCFWGVISPCSSTIGSQHVGPKISITPIPAEGTKTPPCRSTWAHQTIRPVHEDRSV